jgi:RNA polymerase sigma-70 factor (ECF subfamily)
METLDHLASPEAYCRTVLKHICIDRWRAIKARDGDVELVEEIAEANAPPEVERGEAAEFLEHFLANLPERQQRVMRMTMRGDKVEEIAEATGLTEGNIKVIVSRIRQRFKELYYKR